MKANEDIMKRANEVTDELESMGSILAVLSRAMPYSVPAGYFDKCFDFAHKDLINSVTPDTNDPTFTHSGLAGDRSIPFAIPSGYFEGLASNVMAAVNAGAGNELNDLSRKMPGSVPTGYFDALPAQVLQAAKIAHPAKKKTTTIPLVRNTFRQVRWAAAAVLLICIGFGGYVSFFSGGNQNGTESMLANVPSEEIQDYLQHSYILDVNRIVNNNEINKIQVDNTDIIQYLNETGWDVVD